MAKLNPNLSVIKEFRKKMKDCLVRRVHLEDVSARRDKAKEAHNALRKQRLDDFMSGFTVISTKLKEMYQVCASIPRAFIKQSFVHSCMTEEKICA